MQQQDKKSRFIEAWKTVFDAEAVHDDDNFFEAGGDSLKGMQLIGALAERGLKLDMLKIYTQPTVEEMIEELEEMDPVEIPQEMFTGQVTGKQLEKYLQDPQIRKAMADFGIREEDIRANVKTVDAPEDTVQAAPGMGAVNSSGIPGMPAGAVSWVMPQPGSEPGSVPQGYLVPVQLMMFIPAVGPDGTPLPVPPGAIPFPMMAYPANQPQTPGAQDSAANEGQPT